VPIVAIVVVVPDRLARQSIQEQPSGAGLTVEFEHLSQRAGDRVERAAADASELPVSASYIVCDWPTIGPIT
jgi:hypothetical protein